MSFGVGGRHRCIVPHGVAVAAARMGSLCCDYVGWARRLLIRLWEGACLWIIALWERKKKEGTGRERERGAQEYEGGEEEEREKRREKPPWLWLWNGLSQIKATGMRAEMSQSLPQTHWLVRLLHWAYLRLYTPRIHRWMHSTLTHSMGEWREEGKEMRGRQRLRMRGESVKTNMLQIGLQLREKRRKRKGRKENCAQGKHKKIKEKTERGSLRRLAATKGSD